MELTSWPGGAWPTLAWTAVVVAYAALSTVWVGHDPGWYDALERPSFQPPDLVFGLIWPLNFAALLAVGVWFTRVVEPARSWTAWLVLVASVAGALAWAWAFYVPHRLGLAALCLALASLLTWLLLVLVARSVPWAAACLAPYAAWLSTAAALSVQYARLN